MVEIFGHRGARGLFPENTIEGFTATAALGVTHLELDVAVTRDGVAVVSHDPALNPDLTRGPDAEWLSGPGPLLRDVTWRDLHRFDVGRIRPGSRTAAHFPDQAPRDGARIPRLQDVLALGPGLSFVVELKLYPAHPDWTVSAERMVGIVLAASDAAGASSRCTFQSFDWRAPRLIRDRRPELRLAWLTRPETMRDAAVWWERPAPADADQVPDMVAQEGGGIWSPEYADLTRAEVDRAHTLGLRVVPWTVNQVAAMRRLESWGVDGLITDRPDLALAALSPKTGKPLHP